MRALKLTFYAILFVLFSQSIFSSGVYELDGDFIFYTSNSDPLISVNITSPQEPVTIEKARLDLNGNVQEVTFTNRRVNPGGKETVNLRYDDFGFSTPITESDTTFYKLFAYGIDGEEIDPFGDPTEFEIVVDSNPPSIITPVDGSELRVSTENLKLDLLFDEDIKSYAIKINNNVVESYNNPSLFRAEYSSSFEYILKESDLVEGVNTMEFEFFDIAGNRGTASYTILYIGAPIRIKLLSRLDNQSLGFFYDPQYPELFSGKIYYRDEPFDLIFETTKSATCYVSYSLLSFLELKDVSNSSRTVVQSSDGIRHVERIENIGSQKVWIACEATSYEDDVAYLAADLGLGNTLLTFEEYDGNLEIVYALPESTVSSLPFNMNARTSEEAVCRTKIDSETQVDMESDNLIDHSRFDVTVSQGNHVGLYTCFDKIGDVVTKTTSFNVDTVNGARVVSYTPEYLESAASTIEIILSEDVECKYSQDPITTGNYDSLPALTGTGVQRSFTTSNLEEGDNYYYIDCNRNGELFANTIKLIYDPNGPVLDNLTFVNGGVESDYVGDSERIKFEFDLESLIPVDKFHVTISSPNRTLVNEIIGSTKGDIKKDIEDAVRISIIAENRLGRNSTPLEKAIKFDFTKPSISFVQNAGKVRITCIDDESGCHEIEYGLSLTAITCDPRINYDNSSVEIDPFDNNYICAQAEDKVGNEIRDQLALTTAFEGSGNGTNGSVSGDGGLFRNITGLDDNQTVTDDGNDDGGSGDDDSGSGSGTADPFDFDPVTGPPQEDGFPWLILAAILLIVGGIGGGGYYAYKKGYLDDQLKKFGIVRPGSKDDKNAKGGKGTSFNTRKATRPETPQEKKSRYDRNLKKLNNFIDDTLRKGSSVFDKFSGVDKGKVKGYDDTLIKKTPDTKKVGKGRLSKEEFDEFYDKSKGKDDAKIDSNTEKEAEAFEDYYKKKKTTNKKE